jgi:hypothetical protein
MDRSEQREVRLDTLGKETKALNTCFHPLMALPGLSQANGHRKPSKLNVNTERVNTLRPNYRCPQASFHRRDHNFA